MPRELAREEVPYKYLVVGPDYLGRIESGPLQFKSVVGEGWGAGKAPLHIKTSGERVC